MGLGSLARGQWARLPAALRNSLVVIGLGAIGAWAWWSLGTLVAVVLSGVFLRSVGRRPWLQGARRAFVLNVLIVALVLRFIAGAGHYWMAASSGWGVDYFGDARAYSSTGFYIGESLRGTKWVNVENNDPAFVTHFRTNYKGQMPRFKGYRVGFYGYAIGALYGLLGYSPVAVKWFNALAGVVLAWLVFMFLWKEGRPRAAPVALVLTAFWPSLVLWSVTGLKDMGLILLITGMLILFCRVSSAQRFEMSSYALGFYFFSYWFFVPLIARAGFALSKGSLESWRSLKLSTFGAAGVLLITHIRWMVGIVFFIIMVPYLIYEAVRCIGSWVRKRGYDWPFLAWRPQTHTAVLIAILVVGLGAFEVTHGVVFRVAKVMQLTQRGMVLGANPEEGLPKTSYRIYSQRLYEKKQAVDISLKSMFDGFLKGLGYHLFAPYPWKGKTTIHHLAGIQMLISYALYFALVVGIWTLIGTRQWPWFLPLLGFVLFFIVLSSFLEGNVGTLFRHRDMVAPAFLIVTSIGIERLITYRESRVGVTSLRRLFS